MLRSLSWVSRRSANLAAAPLIAQKYQLQLKIIEGDPPLYPLLNSTPLPYTTAPGNVANASLPISSALSGGAVSAQATSAAATISGPLSVSWQSSAVSDMAISSLGADGAVIRNSQGAMVGVGSVSLSVPAALAASVSGSNTYIIDGNGGLSFYGTAETGLGVSGDWTNYTGIAMSNVGITLTTDGLMLNGTPLPAGTYTISAPSVRISGSGGCTAPSFVGSVSISTTGGTVDLGTGSGNLSVGGKPLNPDDETTLDGYTGTISVSANGDGTDSVSLNGNAGNVLQVTTSPATLTTDQNTPVTFATNVQTSLADTYNLTANAPAGWTVSIDSKGNVTATPAPGLQSGTYPIQIIAQSQTDPNLIAQTTVDVTITPTQPGITFTVAPDPLFTVPFNGAQLPTAFRASIQNLGPAADTYNLTFSNVPSGFTLLDSGTSVTVPAGQTGILGLYLQPNTGQPLPRSGNRSSRSPSRRPARPIRRITQTQTVTFTVPAIDAVTVTSNPDVAEHHARHPGHRHAHAHQRRQRAGDQHRSDRHAPDRPDARPAWPRSRWRSGQSTDRDDHADARRLDAAQQHCSRRRSPRPSGRPARRERRRCRSRCRSSSPARRRSPTRPSRPASSAIPTWPTGSTTSAPRSRTSSRTRRDPVAKSQAMANLDSLISLSPTTRSSPPSPPR